MTYEELQDAYFKAVADENEAKAADIAAKIAEIQRENQSGDVFSKGVK